MIIFRSGCVRRKTNQCVEDLSKHGTNVILEVLYFIKTVHPGPYGDTGKGGSETSVCPVVRCV